MGPITDTFGRKTITIAGFMLCGVCLIFMPLFSFNVWPYLYILRIVQTISLVPLINTPMWLDCVQNKSMGVVGTVIQVTATCANLVSTVASLLLSTQVNVGVIFIGFGILTCIVSTVMIFGLKECAPTKKGADEDKKEKLREAVV